ncbi:MAG: response regulator [Planctomycetota bacterium]|jgi:CheY-like chemotaxis protein
MSPSESNAEARQLAVLVVDDDEAAREGIALTLKNLGCNVTTAEDADGAVECFIKGSYDLITLDYRMPGLTGADLHKILSQEFGAGKRVGGPAPRQLPPILIVTGHGDDPEVARTAFGESVIGVIQKPTIEEKLKAVVDDLRGD